MSLVYGGELHELWPSTEDFESIQYRTFNNFHLKGINLEEEVNATPEGL